MAPLRSATHNSTKRYVSLFSKLSRLFFLYFEFGNVINKPLFLFNFRVSNKFHVEISASYSNEDGDERVPVVPTIQQRRTQTDLALPPLGSAMPSRDIPHRTNNDTGNNRRMQTFTGTEDDDRDTSRAENNAVKCLKRLPPINAKKYVINSLHKRGSSELFSEFDFQLGPSRLRLNNYYNKQIAQNVEECSGADLDPIVPLAIILESVLKRNTASELIDLYKLYVTATKKDHREPELIDLTFENISLSLAADAGLSTILAEDICLS